MRTTDATLAKRTPAHFERLARPLLDFIRLEAAGGLVLMAAAAAALAWANSPWAETYHRLWNTEFSFGLSPFALHGSLVHGINDGLMAVFFLMVGLEIKRELLSGQLAGFRKAALPAAAALGGMVLPAVLFTLLNAGHADQVRGWGVPMATDIAFSLGVLGLLGRKRVPISLKVFLTALAIVDDLGAVAVIAFFYTAHVSWPALGVAAGAFAFLLALNRAGIWNLMVYGAAGLVLWLGMLKSGVHATVAGVLLALVVPLRSPAPRQGLPGPKPASGPTGAPLLQLEHALHPWVGFMILPLFALANAGVTAHGLNLFTQLASPVSLGIIAGLFLGKPAGILAACWLTIKLKLAERPTGASWRQLQAAAGLAGIGFTMSMFISNLAFLGHLELAEQAKAGIIAGSLLSALTGMAWFCFAAPRPESRH
ncbi:MAG TPA: Na+/H+ antiporter NhaA [Chthoniobacterales bacterium]